jgi:hypothetical protein
MESPLSDIFIEEGFTAPAERFSPGEGHFSRVNYNQVLLKIYEGKARI